MSLDWQTVGFVPSGPKGDRYRLTFTRDAPNASGTIHAVEQEYNPVTEAYEDVGLPEELGVLYDGWVHVGFWWPYMVDNQDGTIEFFRQWYCRESAESNTFQPEGDPESMGTATLPIGPQGPQGYQGNYYLITANSPAPHVTYFYRELYVYNPTIGDYEPSGTVEQIGGTIAEQGPPGDYYLLTADNPPGEPETIRLYRTRYDGQTEQAEGAPEEIGTATTLQGPEGPQGPPGPQGPQGPPAAGLIYPGTEYRTAGEFQRLSYIARRLTDAMIAAIVEAAETTEAAAAFAGGVIVAIAGAAAAPVSGGLSLFLGGVIGTAFGNSLEGIAESLTAATVGPMTTESAIDGIAKDVYCALMPYRTFDQASIDSFITAYQDRIIFDEIVQGRYSDAVIGLLAHHFSGLGWYRVQEEVAVITLQYTYNPAFDYTSLPCTPNVGAGQNVYLFTEGMQGWEIYVDTGAANNATYYAGEGFGQGRDRYNIPNIGVTFQPATLPLEVTYMRMVFVDLTASGTPNYLRIYDRYQTSNGNGPIQEWDPMPTQSGTMIVEWTPATPYSFQDGIYISAHRTSWSVTSMRLVEVSFTTT